MTDQSLREALEEIARGAVPIGISPAKFARDFLAAHPAEPAPEPDTDRILDAHFGPSPAPVGVEITDDVVTKAARAYSEAIAIDAFGDVGEEQIWDAVRAALEAILPDLTSRPALDREALFRLLHEQGCGCDLTVDPQTFGYQEWLPSHRARYEERADAVMALAVPVPTREQIGRALGLKLAAIEAQDWSTIADAGDGEPIALDAITDVVLALLNGSAK